MIKGDQRLGAELAIGRRQFVRTAGGIFVLAVAGSACRDAGSPGSGTVRVTINGLPSGTAAGSVEITAPGMEPLVIELPAATTGQATVAVGSYHVVYVPPTGFTVAPGTPSEVDVTIEEGEIEDVAFSVVESTQSPPQGVVFSSNFGTARGTTTNAKTDGGRWNVLSDNGGGLEVVAGSEAGFPSANCLRVTARESSNGFHRLAKTGLGVIAAGASVWFRWYYRNDQPSLNDNSQHPIESGQAGGLDWAFNNEVQSNTTWFGDFQSPGDSLTWRQRWRGPLLSSGVVYRFEMQLHKLSATTWNLHVRVYNAANQLIASDADYRNVFSSDGVAAQSVRLADNPVLNFSTNEGSQMDELRAGNNGIGGSDWFPAVVHSHQGCFAVSRSAWLGPYDPSTGI